MALKDFQVDDDDSSDSKDNTTEDNKVTQKQEQSTKEYIASNVRYRVREHELDIDIEDDRLEGDINDIAMLFALMTMDNADTHLDDLINDGE